MFELLYKTKEEVPAEVSHLYKENENGEFTVIPVGEIKTITDVTALQESLRKERNDHKETKGKLTPFSGLDPEKVKADLARIPELEIAAEGNLDDEKTAKLVEAKLKAQLTPVQRELKEAQDKLLESNLKIEAFTQKEINQKIETGLLSAATESKMTEGAKRDLRMYSSFFEVPEGSSVPLTKEGIEGITPGLDPKGFIMAMQPERPNWWEPDKNAGGTGNTSSGAGIVNPFADKTWNLTEQGKMVRSNRAQAERLAEQAGTSIGGGRPKSD